jgi:hypothetical protein
MNKHSGERGNESFFKGGIQGYKELINGYFVNTGSMTECFKVGNLAFITVEIKLFEDGQRFGVLSDDVGDYHFLADH